MEISLSGTITFGAKNHEKQPFDQICIGGTAYLKVNIFIWLTTLEIFPLFLKYMYLIDFFSEKAMAPHSSTLAWKIPWTEGPGGLQSTGSLGVGHD